MTGSFTPLLAARSAALFASDLSAESPHTEEQIAEAIRQAVRIHGGTRPAPRDRRPAAGSATARGSRMANTSRRPADRRAAYRPPSSFVPRRVFTPGIDAPPLAGRVTNRATDPPMGKQVVLASPDGRDCPRRCPLGLGCGSLAGGTVGG